MAATLSKFTSGKLLILACSFTRFCASELSTTLSLLLATAASAGAGVDVLVLLLLTGTVVRLRAAPPELMLFVSITMMSFPNDCYEFKEAADNNFLLIRDSL